MTYTMQKSESGGLSIKIDTPKGTNMEVVSNFVRDLLRLGFAYGSTEINFVVEADVQTVTISRLDECYIQTIMSSIEELVPP